MSADDFAAFGVGVALLVGFALFWALLGPAKLVWLGWCQVVRCMSALACLIDAAVHP